MSKHNPSADIVLLRERVSVLREKQGKGFGYIKSLSKRVAVLEVAYYKLLGGLLVLTSGIVVMLIREFIK